MRILIIQWKYYNQNTYNKSLDFRVFIFLEKRIWNKSLDSGQTLLKVGQNKCLFGLVPFVFETVHPFECSNTGNLVLEIDMVFCVSSDTLSEFDCHFLTGFSVDFSLDEFPRVVNNNFGCVLLWWRLDNDEVVLVLNYEEFFWAFDFFLRG